MAITPKSISQRNFVIALAIAAVLFSLRFFQIVNFREADAVDLRILLRGEQKAHPDLLLVEVDDASLETLGQWPWPKRTHLLMLELLSRYQPRLVFYDVLFTESDENSKDDEALSRLMEKSANVILPFFYYSEEPMEAFYPIKLFRESARAIGFMNFASDPDGHVRRFRSSLKAGGVEYYHTAMLSVLSGLRDEESARRWGRSLPLNERGELWINFPGAIASFQHVSFRELLEAAKGGDDEKLKKLIKNKIVLVGQTARGSQHVRPTAFSTDTPGIVIQASAMHTLLSRKFLLETGPITAFSLMLFLCFWTALLVSAVSARRALLLVMGSIGAYSLANFFIFYFFGVLLPAFMPIIAMVLTYVSLLFFSNSDMRFQGELVKRELAMAAKIQATFLPEMRPNVPGFDMAFKCHFAEHIGGDFYDWADFGGGRMAFAVGDVSGKGIPAAIYMVCAISEFRRENRPGRSPSKTLKALNMQLATQTYSGMFLTITQVVVDRHEKTLVMSSAGHEPFLYYHAASKKTEVIDPPKGPPLGLFTDAQYEDFKMAYEDGDVLVLISDGVKESRDLKGQPMGVANVESYLREHALFQSSEQMVQGIFELMEDHLSGSSAHDDRTVFCVKFGQRF